MILVKVDISDDSNKIINIIKNKYRLKNKGQAIDLMAKQYIDKKWNRILKEEEFKRALIS